MRGLFVVAITQSTQRRIDCVVGHSTSRRAFGRKDEPTVACERLNLAQYRDGLFCQGHDVLLAHLHFCAGYPPLALVEVDFAPFGLPQLAWANKYQWRKTKRTACSERAGVALNSPHEFTDFAWRFYRSVVTNILRW